MINRKSKYAIVIFFKFLLGTGTFAECKPLAHINVFTDTTRFLLGQYQIYIGGNSPADFTTVLHAPDTAFISISDNEKYILPGADYWLKVKVLNLTGKNIIVCFTTHRYYIDFYSPDRVRGYTHSVFSYEDFVLNRPFFTTDNYISVPYTEGIQTYYLKLKSNVHTGMGFVLMSNEQAHNKSVINTAYHFLFLGIMFFVILLNLTVYIRLREIIYLYYLLYSFSIVVFASCIWGYTLFLLNFKSENMYAESIPYSMATIFLLLYSKEFLNLKKVLPLYSKWVNYAIVGKICTYTLGILTVNSFWHQAYIDSLCLLPALVSSFMCYTKGFKAARFFLLSFLVIYVGFFLHATFEQWIENLLYRISTIEIYLSGYTHFFFFSTLAEVALFTAALAERFNNEKKQLIIEQNNAIHSKTLLLEKQHEVIQLKEQLNHELESLVRERTIELQQANALLKIQSTKLAQLNDSLEEDNKKLHHDIEEIKQAKLLKPDTEFSDFEKIFTDNNACLHLISTIKWSNGYICVKCGYKKFHAGKKSFARKCKACGYDESATAHTVLEGIKFPLNKALYIIYIKFFNKNIKINQIAEQLQLREATAYMFSKKVDEIVHKHKHLQKSWVDIIKIHS